MPEHRAGHRAILFAATAGPRRGFGHLLRCGVLASALGAARVIVLREVSATTRQTAERLGWRVCTWRDATIGAMPDLLVVDDPSPAHVRRWIRRARSRRMAIATIHDGRSIWATADLVIDGSATSRYEDRPGRVAGAAFAIIRTESVPRVRRVDRAAPRVLISLGGGVHVRRLGAPVARAIVRRRPDVEVDVACGFVPADGLPALPRRCQWLAAPHGLTAALSASTACVVAGGVTLYEACALGTPTVAVPVVAAQRPTISAFVRAGAAMTVDVHTPATCDRIAAAVASIIDGPRRRRTLSRNARQLVDGHGTWRVARRLLRLLDQPQSKDAHVAA